MMRDEKLKGSLLHAKKVWLFITVFTEGLDDPPTVIRQFELVQHKSPCFFNIIIHVQVIQAKGAMTD